MKKIIKVCGMRDPENITDLMGLKPDMIGLIFHPGSPRYVENEKLLGNLLNQGREFKLVGVFVNEKLSTILELNKILNFDFVQLHGKESIAYCVELKSNKLKIIKAFGISEKNDFTQTTPYSEFADYFVFDNMTRIHGGSGRKFDWEILNYYSGSTPFLLSGGIGPEDFPDIKHTAFAGLDLNSRFEISPGFKNISLLSNYLKKVRHEQ